VSIIVNCYNGEKYLKYALDSVIAQTYTNWEVVFWDNQSTDNSVEIFRSYDDDRFKYCYSEKHTLLYEARNSAIEKASGELIAFLDVDDWWSESKLELQVPCFQDLSVGVVCSNFWIFNEEKKKKILAHNSTLPTGMVLNELLEHYFVGLLTLVFRRSCWGEKEHMFDPRYQVIGDFDAVIKLASDWKLDSVQEPLATYRWHGENISVKQSWRQVEELGLWLEEMSYNKHLSSLSGFKKQNNFYQYIKARRYVDENYYRDAFEIFMSLPFNIYKIKLFAALVLPGWLLKPFKTFT